MPVGQMKTLRAVHTLGLVAVVGAMILLSGCGGVSEAEVAQAKAGAAEAQAQKDTMKHQRDAQATLSADVKRLKDEEANAAAAKVAAENAAAKAEAEKAAAAKTAKAKAVSAAAEMTPCKDNVSAGANTSCTFAKEVALHFESGEDVFEAWSTVKRRYYTMTCTRGVTSVCRGGNNAVVYIR